MSSNGSALDESANLEVCVAALKAFTSFVMAASSKIQASLYKVGTGCVYFVILIVVFSVSF